MNRAQADLPGISGTPRATASHCTRIATAGTIPSQISGHAMRKVRLIVSVNGFQDDEEVHIDDMAMFRIE